ncbi:phytanoyl-CoA dioxygenase family protein [Paenibacillus cellulositrophicus]|uniref:phytanoyl-CoA dioxygenase family protein n=1 Tax=Paenibacillus cellulositrophicus TaxID=562959 RepID=UPI00203A5760|nr:phytanoyl-CoA dioxygenase family protein [Paenibacillus cellulositrophicus]MCM2997733.1 phytanoyl-CoA dioxygenase family protein [Paenibacillus cellulositrophicus]
MISREDVEFYNENGYLLVRGVFSTEEVKDMQYAVERTIAKAAAAKQDVNHTWQGDYIPQDELKKLVLKGFHDLQFHDACFTRAVAHPRMTGVLTQLIGPNVQLHHTKMLVKPPEQGAAFPMHQDYPYFPHDRHTMLAASVHLDDADMENGCLCVVPGSHKQGPLPHVGRYYLDHRDYPVSMGTPCPASAGDVLFFNYLTIHGSDRNKSSRPRRNVLFQYRDPADPPSRETHIDWGMGMMVAGEDPQYRQYHAKLELNV